MTRGLNSAIALLLLVALATASAMTAITSGSHDLAWREVWTALFSSSDPLTQDIVLNLRLPRALAAFACGGLLALSGALMQVLLRNPLADPYILGVSGGAAVGALLALLLGLPWLLVHAGAFAGALLSVVLVFGLARGDGSWTHARLLLTGVTVAAGCGAIVTLILSLAPEAQLRGMLFWLMGDLGQVDVPWAALSGLGLVLLLILPWARDLNVLARGELTARSLGVPVTRLRWGIFALASLAAALAVTTAGSIGFVGLIVPHLVRQLLGNDQRLVLPAAILAGGSLLMLADTAARTWVAPQQLPVGVLTALIGVPAFLFLLNRQPRAGVA